MHGCDEISTLPVRREGTATTNVIKAGLMHAFIVVPKEKVDLVRSSR